jgi:hypothetical protein
MREGNDFVADTKPVQFTVAFWAYKRNEEVMAGLPGQSPTLFYIWLEE